MTKKQILYRIVPYIGIFSLGFFVHYYFIQTPPATTGRSFTLRENDANYKYINPLLLCDLATLPSSREPYQKLKVSVEDFLKKNATPKDIDVGIYLRQLNSAQWFGLNEEELFTPASLLKVPVMIAYFKLSEKQPGILDKLLTYDGTFDDNKEEIFKSSYDISPGVYSVNELLKAMVVNSDNNAFHILSSELEKNNSEILSEVYGKLNLSIPEDATPYTDFMSAKSYSYFFRVLFNATYLNKANSVKALELLAGPDFPEGLKAGIPKDVVIAQKFGERSVYSADGVVLKRELHDCGIVYAPTKPYFLCVMTRGHDFNDLLGVIQGVSHIAYEALFLKAGE